MRETSLAVQTAEGFSVLIPVFNGGYGLELCLQSLEKNSRLPHEVIALVDPERGGSHIVSDLDILNRYPAVRVIKNSKNLGPYGSWNRGRLFSSKEVYCFTTQDIYFAPDWDIAIWKHLTPQNILTAQAVEPGIVRPYHAILIRDFGKRAADFDETGFLHFVEQNKEDRLSIDGFFVPTVVHKRLFGTLGGWPDEKPFPYPNDRLFRKRVLWKRGLEYQRVKESFVYHFQDGKNFNINGGGFHFDRKDLPEKGVFDEGTPRLKSKVVGKLIQLGLKKKRVSGWYWPKKADLRLAYAHCVGRGVEIGAGSNRFPNVNAISVDLYTEFKNRIYPPPDITGSAYDLSFLKDESRDFIISSHLLEHLINPLKALKEWKRILKPAGVVFSIVPDKRYVPIPVDNLAPETTLEELLRREALDLVETADRNPNTSSRAFSDGELHGVFHPKGKPGWRHFSYWTPQSLKPVLEYAGFEVVKILEAPEKNIGLDTKPFNWDDFTLVARIPAR